MAHKQLSRRHKAITLVPLLVVCGLWTVSLTGLGSSATAVADTKPDDGSLPDGTSVPSKAIQAPANVPVPGVIAPGVPRGSAKAVVDSASTSGIPSAALSAYQRASQIIDAADKTCHLSWQLIAAIGRVESDHGRYGGNVLTAKGVSRPGIYGPVLNGKNGTQAVPDTDGGALDKDKVWDRAVGPMQFLPSTWSAVKVDADGDGRRNPQDIDDASLGTAVYLCSGGENLATATGERKAVYRYNHSAAYVDLVLRIMKAYQSGDYTAVPDGTSGGSVFAPNPSHQLSSGLSGLGGGGGGTGDDQSAESGSSGGGSSGGGSSSGGTTPTSATLDQLGLTASYCTARLGDLAGTAGAMSACESRVGGLTQVAADDLLGGKSPAQVLAILGVTPPSGP